MNTRFFNADPETSVLLWHETEAAHARMMEILNESERRFIASSQDIDCVRFACTDSLIAVAAFVKKMGITSFGSDRLDELIFSLARANWGQSTPLLARAKMRPGLSPVDRMRQGAAQVCVELYAAARLPALEARKRTARLFQLKRVKGLGVETLAKLGSRLSGRAAKSDPVYDYYRMAMDYARHDLERRGAKWPPNQEQAHTVAKALVELAIKSDKAAK